MRAVEADADLVTLTPHDPGQRISGVSVIVDDQDVRHDLLTSFRSRKCEIEPSALPRPAINPDPALVRLDDAPGDE